MALNGERVGWFELRNPLIEGHSCVDKAIKPGDRTLIVRSGCLDEPYRTWGQHGANAFGAWCERLRALSAGARVSERPRILIRPHHLDVLSDVQRCLGFVRAETGGLELAFDPIAMLAPTMLERAEDHLTRFAEVLEGCPGIGAIVLTNAIIGEDGLMDEMPIHVGLIASTFLEPFARIARDRKIPLILTGESETEQIGLLESWIG